MASPRTVCAPNDSATPFSGWPSKRFRNISDHAAVKPQFAGRSGDIVTPLAASASTHSPSEPSRGQLAPPSPRTVGPGPGPVAPAEPQHGRTHIDGLLAIRRLEQ